MEREIKPGQIYHDKNKNEIVIITRSDLRLSAVLQ